MALPFFNNSHRRKLDQIVAIDLGNRFTKAVHVQRRSDGLALGGFAILDAPLYEKTMPVELLKEHLAAVLKTLDTKAKHVALTVGVNDAIVRHVDMPAMPDDDLRQILKNNSRTYLQQDLSGYIFDFFRGNATAPKADAKNPGSTKQTILIAAAKNQLVDDYSKATKGAGLIADHIVPCVIGPVNAFENAFPDAWKNDVVALVDLGFKSSSISIVREGELGLNRVVGIGGDKLTTGLADAMSISYAEAEGIKIGMPSEVNSVLEALLIPLARELRASMDFFEHQQDRAISRVLISGATAKSEFVLQVLRQELGVECTTWDSTQSFKHALPPEQLAELEQVHPQLSVAIGTALTVL
ncbi:MAG TPA: pilus assembly protein PilM [Verrucomicrobiae bacterium]|nr:pilus assembly protein PilM [Verrucomicrobiae bacterium]